MRWTALRLVCHDRNRMEFWVPKVWLQDCLSMAPSRDANPARSGNEATFHTITTSYSCERRRINGHYPCGRAARIHHHAVTCARNTGYLLRIWCGTPRRGTKPLTMHLTEPKGTHICHGLIPMRGIGGVAFDAASRAHSANVFDHP